MDRGKMTTIRQAMRQAVPRRIRIEINPDVMPYMRNGADIAEAKELALHDRRYMVVAVDSKGELHWDMKMIREVGQALARIGFTATYGGGGTALWNNETDDSWCVYPKGTRMTRVPKRP